MTVDSGTIAARESLPRRVALAVLTRAVRGGQERGGDWGEAVLADFHQVEGSWAAVRWAMGGVLVARRERDGRLRAERRPLTVRAKVVRAGVTLAVLLLLGGLTERYLVTTYFMPSGAMEPTIRITDRVVVDRVAFRLTGLDRGDLVIVQVPDDPLGADQYPALKRVIGLGGDAISCESGVLHRNGEAVDEPYVARQHDTYCDPVTAPEGTLYLLGDNRRESADSRNSHGALSQGAVVGRVVSPGWQAPWFLGSAPPAASAPAP